VGYNDENSGRIVFDIETAPLPEAADYIEPAEAPANYKDPVKIAAAIAEKNAENLAKCGLDVDLCRVVAIGYQIEGDEEPQAVVAVGGDGWSEDGLIRAFWALSAGKQLIGYNCLGFDLPVLLRRSLYLGVKAPRILIDRFKHPQVIDLMDELSYSGKLRLRGLSFYAKRFGLAVHDELTGADIAQAVTDGRWDDIAAHVRADVLKTALLAERLGHFRCVEAAVL
jgi:predicted PolB exonuclease-like 3'-5' exonuclease